MKHIAVLLCFVFACGCTSTIDRSLIQICPVVPEGTPGAVPFAYDLIQVSSDQPKQAVGFYSDSPLLDAASLSDIRNDFAEVAAAPWPSVRLVFSRDALACWRNAGGSLRTGEVAVVFSSDVVTTLDAEWFTLVLTEMPDPHVLVVFPDYKTRAARTEAFRKHVKPDWMQEQGINK